jgi:hypothetical protein
VFGSEGINNLLALIHIQMNEGIVTMICIISHSNALLVISADALEVDNPQVFNQKTVYGSETKLAGVTALRNDTVMV